MRTTLGKDLALWNSCSFIVKACGSSFALDSEFLSVVTLPVAVQPTSNIMLLSGWNSRQTTYKQQD